MATPRRPITSCLECYRRKQKCNRLQPCDQCCSRKVPEKCYFSGHLVVTNTSPEPGNAISSFDVGEDDSNNTEATQSPPSLVSQAGYSASPGSDTFLKLRSKNLCKGGPFGSTPASVSQQGRQTSYLNIIARLPPPEIVEALLDYFANEVYWTFMAIDEHHLKNLFHQWRITAVEEYIQAGPNNPQRELLFFPALLFQVLAQILFNLPPQHPVAKSLKLNDYADCDRLSRTYHFLGNRLIAILGRQNPTLCSIQHDIVSGAWLKDSSRGTEAWYRLGDAVRQAQELGLHRLPQSVEQAPEKSLESNLLQVWDLEHRKRIWTRLFILDSLLALMLGRPRVINREDFSTPTPLNIEYPKDPARTLPLSSDDSPFFGMMVFVSLAHHIHDMLSLKAKGIFAGDYSKLLAVHDEIYALRYKLPLPTSGIESSAATNTSALRLSVLRLSLLNSINAVLMALHRPLIASNPASRLAAVNAALEGLDLQHSIFDLIPRSQSRFYGTVFSTIEACIFLCGIMTELPPQDPNEDRRIRQAILQGMGRLSTIKDRSALAESGEQILRQFYQEIQAIQPPKFEQRDWFPSHSQQSDLLRETVRFRDVAIPSPQQPAYETFQSLFETEKNSIGSFENLQNQDWELENMSQGGIEDLLNQNEFFSLDYNGV